MRRSYPRFHLVLVLALALGSWSALGLFATTAAAQADPDLEKAKGHYIAAEAAMQRGEYATAATEYQAAYDITKDPVLFYKLATAHEKAGRCDEALVFYRRYLAEGQPDEQFKTLTEERIAACEAGVVTPPETPDPKGAGTGAGAAADTGTAAGTDDATSAGDTASAPTPDQVADDMADDTADGTSDEMPVGSSTAPPSFTASGPTWKGKAAWSSLAVALGFGTVSAVLALSASSQEQDIQNLIDFRDGNNQPAEYNGTVRARYEDFVDKGETHATWSRIALGAAGLSIAAAVGFFVWDRSDRKAQESRSADIVPLISPQSVGVSAGWRF